MIYILPTPKTKKDYNHLLFHGPAPGHNHKFTIVFCFLIPTSTQSSPIWLTKEALSSSLPVPVEEEDTISSHHALGISILCLPFPRKPSLFVPTDPG